MNRDQKPKSKFSFLENHLYRFMNDMAVKRFVNKTSILIDF